MTTHPAPNAWSVAAHAPLTFAHGPLIAGILNCTPDSFADGGRHATAEAAIEHGVAMVGAGADVIDVGGESTRPGAARVAAGEQIARVEPVIRGLRRRCAAAISVDTTLGDVAAAALEAGANIVNDVSGGTEDPRLLRHVASSGAGLVLMHRRCPPDQDRYSDQYAEEAACGDVVGEVLAALRSRAAAAEDAGVRRDQIVIDPGFGFGKSVAQNFELLRRLREIVAAGFPVLVGLSRKSFLGAVCGGVAPRERLPASLAAAALAAQRGAHVLRVHDVAEHRQMLRIFSACREC